MAAASRNNISASPIYDVTPMLRPNGAAAVNVDSLEHTDHMSGAFNATPVCQDTPSQSVDSTEEVTQEHNVQAQLEKLTEEYGARVAANQNMSKLGVENNQDTAPPYDRGLAEELRAPTAIHKKKRLAVAKRKVSAVSPEKFATVGAPRRSLRVVANTRMNITDPESMSPKKSSSAKCARAVEKTYAPDVGDDGALDDDAGGFEDAADKIKRRKRHIDGDVPSCSGLKNTHGGKKPRAINKPQGHNKNSDAANVHSKQKFQQTVRCSLREVLEAVKLLKDRHIVKVRLAGFGCVFDWVLEGNVTRILMCYLMMKIDTPTMKIQCGSGRVLEVNREAVHQVFGFPMGGDTAPRPADSGHDESLSILKKELGFERNASIETKDLRSLLASLVNDPGKDDLAVKVFFAILYNKLICPGLAVRLGREAAMLVNMDYEKMSKMDFCQLVVDEIKRAAEKFQDRTIKQSGPEGCGIVPVVMYLDSCNSAKYSVMHTKTPRANYLHEKPLRDIFYKDMMFNGGSDILNYKFGNVTWKGRNDIAYSYRLPEEELRQPSLSSLTRSSSLNSDHVPLAASQHELLLSQDHAAISDITPMRRPDGAAAVNVDSLECNGGPLFYSTPLQVVYDGNNVTEPVSAAFDATPLWQDTPSPSVDGTEDVTQKHNFQAQSKTYAEEYGTRVAAYQKEMKAFYERNPSRLKKHQDTAPSCDCGLAEELRAPTAIRKKKRLDVAKRKASTVSPEKLATAGTPRRSPRIVANTRMNITDQESTSPGKSRLAKPKRARAVEKTYAPDVVDDGALDDDDSDFEEAADKIKRRKRHIDGDVTSCSGLKNTHGGKKPRAINKPQGHNKNSDAANVHPKRKFQQTVRCSLREVLEAVKLLKDRHIVKVRLAGFGCVFDWVLEANVTRILMCYLMMKIDTSTMKVQCGSGRVLEVNREAVHQVFGFPMGGNTAPRPADSGHDESLFILKKELGFERNTCIETKDLRSLLASLVNDPGKDDLAVKVFFAILYNKLICPGLSVRLGREAAMLVNMDYEKMSKMDFCQLVVDEIKRAAEKYQDRTIKQSGPEGCGVVPVVMYLDSCNSAKYSVMHTKTPRANYLHEKPLREIFYMDMMFNGGSDILNYKFGNVTWKGRNDIAYSYRLPEEELRFEPSLSSPTRSASLNSDPVPLAASQHELSLSQDHAAFYDVTHMLRPDGVTGVNVDSLEHSGGPLSYSTPLQVVYDGNNVTEPMSTAFDATPVCQDTPSQSVDDTEEVTQEHSVQAQSEKYAEEYGAKVAAHQKELKAFHERNPSRLKKHQDTSPSSDRGLAEELRAPTAIQKKKRLDVAKGKVSAVCPEKPATVGTPQRSPRVVANTRMDITDRESTSPGKSRSPKRALAVEKTYAPNVVDDGALDDDASDFEDVADKWKGRNDIAYSYRLPEEERCLEPSLSSLTRFSSLNPEPVSLAASQHELLLSQHQKLHLKNRAGESDGEERPSLESIMIVSLKRRNAELEAELAAALKLARENLDEAIESREQVVKAGDMVMNMFEELKKKMMNSNFDLMKKVRDLQMQIEVGRKDALHLH